VCHFPHPYITWIETEDGHLSTAMFGIKLDPNFYESIRTVGFVVKLYQPIESVALTFEGDHIDIETIQSLTFQSDTHTNEYSIRHTNNPETERFILRERRLDWEFGLSSSPLFRANLTATISDIADTSDLLWKGIETSTAADQLGKLLTYIQRDIYFPAK
jgi:hypothetical protein